MIFLTIILFVAVVALLYLFFTLKTKENSLKQEFELCKSEHKLVLSELEKRMNTEISNQVGTQVQQWRDKECEIIRQEQKDIANREAATHLEKWKFDNKQAISAESIKQSQSVINGNVTQHIIPYLPEFNYNPKDVRFFGSPIDLIVFDGLNDGFLKEIVFIEVKTGTSALTPNERKVRNAIEQKLIKWVTMRVNHETNGSPITIDAPKKVIRHEVTC